ncbi:Gfo/Idh/MocA family protein [Bryobacter aggregatus]|uniref:Gfo/Idh/MocA family protein n=1 Tax=Bryobacter aggregatus TaxID=360054 RepID=UPI0004E106A5|nr:Gfo/Idh/MocA family oxidoreductase [Bryobacter aggregatus]
MKVGLIGTGAIAHKHAQAYKNIGYEIVAVSNKTEERGRAFAAQWGGEFFPDWADVCTHPKVDFIDLCTFPDVRFEPLKLAADAGKHVQVQKPIAIDVATAQAMVDYTKSKNVLLNVVSQGRFYDAVMFLKRAVDAGRLGKIFQADAYVKWWRSEEYYSRPIKGSWAVEGGGSLINQGIHQVDWLLYLMGGVTQVFGQWQLGARHKIESDDVLSAVLRYASGATGVIQTSTAMWPGFTERVELHGTKGSAILSGNRLTTWDVIDDQGEAAPLSEEISSGSSDPMAISVTPFERTFLNFGEAIAQHKAPLINGEEGLRALELVQAIYTSARENRLVQIGDARG